MCSCHVASDMKSDAFDSDETVLLKLHVEDLKHFTRGSTTNFSTTDDEYQVKKLEVLVFDEGKKYLYSGLVESPLPLTGNSGAGEQGNIFVRVKACDSQRRIVLIFNYNGDDVNPVTGETYTDVMNRYIFKVNQQGAYPDLYTTFPQETGIPLYAELLLDKIVNEPINITTDVSLIRSLARVDIGLNLINSDNEATVYSAGIDGYELKSVHVYNSLDRGYVRSFDEPGTGSYVPNIPYNNDNTNYFFSDNWLVYDQPSIAEKSERIRHIYLPEQLCNERSAGIITGEPLPRNLRCCLVVGISNGTNTYYYRLDFADPSQPDKKILNIYRGHRYVFNIKSINLDEVTGRYVSPSDAFNGVPMNYLDNASVTLSVQGPSTTLDIPWSNSGFSTPLYPHEDMQNATEKHVGWVITKEGSLYPTTAQASQAGETPVAMLAYVGTTGVGSYTALAISLKEVANVDFANLATATTSLPTVPDGTSNWLIPTKALWELLVGNDGSKIDSFHSMMIKCGAEEGCMNSSTKGYWSESLDTDNAYMLIFNESSKFWNIENKANIHNMRGVFAFN